MRSRTRKALSGLVSLSILAVVWLSIDRRKVLSTFAAANVGWFALAIGFFVPQKLLQAWRWRRMAENFCRIGTGEAVRLILAGDTLNLVLPSKMGDTAKAVFLLSEGRLPLAYGLNLVAFEKMLDMSALCLLLLVGVAAAGRFDVLGIAACAGASAVIAATAAICVWALAGGKGLGFVRKHLGTGGAKGKLARLVVGTAEVVGDLASRGGRLGRLVVLSLSIWVLHLVQIYCFFLALRSSVPFFTTLALMPLAIFIGLLPITIAGVGTRDAAMVVLFRPYEATATIAGAALLTHLRYLVPGLAGLPFFHSYLKEIQEYIPSKAGAPGRE